VLRTAGAGTCYFSADGYIPAGQSAGRLFVEVLIYDGSGSARPGGGIGRYLPAATGVRVHGSSSIDVSAFEIALPASMKLVIGTEKTPAGGSLQGYIDAVRLIYDPVFIDDFESPPTSLAYPAVTN
jgi:hypothetical protein